MKKIELDPVGSTVRYDLMKLCTGSVQDSNGKDGQVVISDLPEAVPMKKKQRPSLDRKTDNTYDQGQG